MKKVWLVVAAVTATLNIAGAHAGSVSSIGIGQTLGVRLPSFSASRQPTVAELNQFLRFAFSEKLVQKSGGGWQLQDLTPTEVLGGDWLRWLTGVVCRCSSGGQCAALDSEQRLSSRQFCPLPQGQAPAPTAVGKEAAFVVSDPGAQCWETVDLGGEKITFPSTVFDGEWGTDAVSLLNGRGLHCSQSWRATLAGTWQKSFVGNHDVAYNKRLTMLAALGEQLDSWNSGQR